MKKKSLGELIEYGRNKMGMSLKELSERTGFEYTYLSKIENDRYIPSLKVLHKLSEVLDLSYPIVASYRFLSVLMRKHDQIIRSQKSMEAILKNLEKSGLYSPIRAEDLREGHLPKEIIHAIARIYGISNKNVKRIAKIICFLSEYESEERTKRIEAITALLKQTKTREQKNSS